MRGDRKSSDDLLMPRCHFQTGPWVSVATGNMLSYLFPEDGTLTGVEGKVSSKWNRTKHRCH